MAAGSAMVILLRSPLLLLAGTGGGILTVAAFPRLIPSSVLERLGDTTVEEKGAYDQPATFDQLDRSSAHRLLLWRGAARMIAQYPIQGVGIGLFQVMIGNYTEVPLRKEDPHDAHNAFILLASEMGLPELLMLLLLHCCFAILALRLYLKRRMLVDRVLGLSFIGCQVGVLVSCMLGSRFSDEALITFFWMMAAMLCVVSRMREPLPPRKRRSPFAPGARALPAAV
jgi:O-antigen ligase